jgi:hypothetical protein
MNMQRIRYYGLLVTSLIAGWGSYMGAIGGGPLLLWMPPIAVLCLVTSVVALCRCPRTTPFAGRLPLIIACSVCGLTILFFGVVAVRVLQHMAETPHR